MITASQAIRLAAGAVVLLALTFAVLRAYGVALGAAPYLAVLRGWCSWRSWGWRCAACWPPPTAAAVLVVMLAAATYTSTRRLRALDRPARAVVPALTTGAATALVVVFAVGVLPFSARYVIALGRIVIGNAMTAATLAGSNLVAGLRARREEVEAWLSLGATPRQAVLDVARRAAGEALVPAIDQTRTTGLVTLPGAFIGALLGGASPVQAARFQLVVLVSIMAAQAITAVGVVHILGAPATLPES